jgi:heat shock protein HspQ
LAENAEAYYVAYVSEQNLIVDDTGDPIEHPQVTEMFGELREGTYLGWQSDKLH